MTYTGQTINFRKSVVKNGKTVSGDSTAVQIDHVVALNDAWASGLWKNSRKNDRVKYANDPDVLLASQGDANNAKSEGINLYGSGVPKKSVGRWAASTHPSGCRATAATSAPTWPSASTSKTSMDFHEQLGEKRDDRVPRAMSNRWGIGKSGNSLILSTSCR